MARRCVTCKANNRKADATWAMQFMAEDTPTFTTFGWHYRGTKVFPVCDDCQAALSEKSIKTWADLVALTANAKVVQ